ncbi:MAG: DNA (cytosine-5-)-methyltransferase [Patescibacteria group bacterium]|nr:MAG: DNA (cytosine-5-)-methyltransferase [Patescibacteria group bacterium]
MAKLYTVLEASNIINVSPDTIRRWEKKGLIRADRSKLNYRLFNIEELQRIINKNNGNQKKNYYKILKSKEKSDYSVIELFAGAGGTAIGFEHAGLRHVLLSDIDKNSVQTLKMNKPKWNVVQADITKMDFKGLKADIVEGGFPCQAFSYAGKKLGFEDARGTLFFDFARCVKEVRPKVLMGENVRGLLKHENGKTLKSILNVLIELGYNVAFRVLKAQYFDVPQKRERLIILGVRKDLDLPIFFPKEKDYTISLREALENCPYSEGQKYPERKKEIMDLIPPGGYWRDLPLDLQKEYMRSSYYMGGGKTGMARRLSWDEPSLTLTCAPAQKQTERCHPEETRPLNVREYARIQTFPDTWKFSGPISSQYKQIGNAVPANLGYHIGRCIIAMLDKKIDSKTMYKVEPIDKIDDLIQLNLFGY